MLGTWMQVMAQGWVLAGLTSTAFTLGLVNFVSGVPLLALTMFGGMMADRHDKRIILIIVMVAQAILAVTIGLLVQSGQIVIWHIAVAGALLGLSTAFEMPAAAALVPELVSKEEMRSAIALDRSIFHATRLAGPALGGVLISWLGTAAAFFANAASFSALIIALLTISPRKRGSVEEEKLRQGGMRDGIAHVRNDQPTRTMLLLLSLTTCFISPFFMILVPLYSRHVLGIDARQHGFLMAASGVGAFLGSIQLLRIAHSQRVIYLRGAVAIITVAMMILGLARGLWVALPAMIGMMMGTSTMYGLANTIVQERAPDFIRGRVSAIAGLSFFGVLPFAGLLTAKLSDWAGMRTAMIGAAICYGICTAALLCVRSRLEAAPAEPAPVEEAGIGH
ncbi:MAG: Major facilitator superfamily 1 [Chthoniobacteraceae bacterium]|nr:Major facilitator superfamily 1 [Chthoniobacteraceae bacterium]